LGKSELVQSIRMADKSELALGRRLVGILAVGKQLGPGFLWCKELVGIW